MDGKVGLRRIGGTGRRSFDLATAPKGDKAGPRSVGSAIPLAALNSGARQSHIDLPPAR